MRKMVACGCATAGSATAMSAPVVAAASLTAPWTTLRATPASGPGPASRGGRPGRTSVTWRGSRQFGTRKEDR
jgi:hypothetical protein